MARVRSRQQLSRARVLGRLWGAVLGLVLATSAVAGVAAPAADAGGARPTEITGTHAGRVIALAASQRISALGERVRATDLVVWRDAAGVLVAPRAARLGPLPRAAGARGRELVAVVAAGEPGSQRRERANALPTDDVPPASWSLVVSACYERMSDTWSWLDHCARIYRLAGDGDPTRDYYGLQRVATAGANVPWVLKSAAIGAQAVDGTLMSWVDWSPRGDRSGPCQPYIVWVTAPLGGLLTPADRCETWDITKGQRGGDFRLDWYGCACTHDRALAFDVSVSVPQGRSPAWYVPAEVHGFPF